MSSEVDTFQSIKGLLQKSQQVGAIKVDLFSHITEIVNRIISHHKYDAYQKFEEISLLVKKTQLKIKNPKPIEEFRKLNSDDANNQLDKYVDSVRSLLNDKVLLSASDKKLIKKNPECVIGDFLEQNEMLKFAGISFGESETYRIYKSMTKLAKMSGASTLRFWGKLFGSKHDYFILEGTLNQHEELELPANFEARGNGVNKNVYWVTDNLLSDWVQLPDVNPE